MKRVFILICLLLFVQLIFVGQTDDWKKFYNQSFDYFYNGEYEKAIDCLEEALKLDPTQPSIYWRLCCVLSFKINATNDIKGKNSIPKEKQKKLEKEFCRAFNAGKALCDPNSADPETLFYLGALYANKVFFAQKKGLSSRNDTNKSREYLRKIREAEDFYYEARGYLGIFNFGPIVMSGVEKRIVDAFFEWDEEKGLQQIKDAIEHSKYSDYFKVLYRGTLQVVVERRKRKDKIPEAIELTEELLKKYPKNLELKIDLVILYCKKGDLLRAAEMGDKLFYEEVCPLKRNPRALERYYVSYWYNKLARIREEIKREAEKIAKEDKN